MNYILFLSIINLYFHWVLKDLKKKKNYYLMHLARLLIQYIARVGTRSFYYLSEVINLSNIHLSKGKGKKQDKWKAYLSLDGSAEEDSFALIQPEFVENRLFFLCHFLDVKKSYGLRCILILYEVLDMWVSIPLRSYAHPQIWPHWQGQIYSPNSSHS